jgi:hypothetical protein
LDREIGKVEARFQQVALLWKKIIGFSHGGNRRSRCVDGITSSTPALISFQFPFWELMDYIICQNFQIVGNSSGLPLLMVSM